MLKRCAAALIFCSLFSAGIVSAQGPGPRPVEMPPSQGECRPMPPPHHRQREQMAGKRLEAFLQQLPESERAKMKELAEKDPRAFRQAVMNYFREQQKKEMEEIMALRKACLEAPDGEKKEAAKAALRKKLEEGFQRHLDASDRKIHSMEEQLKNLQAGLDAAKKRQEEQKASKDKIINKIMTDMLDPQKPFPPPPREKGKDRPIPPPPGTDGPHHH